MIEVHGAHIPRAALARLAARLQHEGHTSVSHRLGHAIDHNLDSLALTAREIEVILATLVREPVVDLEPLRDRLLETSGVRRPRGVRGAGLA
jgi:hypothetical protein